MQRSTFVVVQISYESLKKPGGMSFIFFGQQERDKMLKADGLNGLFMNGTSVSVDSLISRRADHGRREDPIDDAICQGTATMIPHVLPANYHVMVGVNLPEFTISYIEMLIAEVICNFVDVIRIIHQS
jgi:hypothetical protein